MSIRDKVIAEMDSILHPYIPKNVNPDNWQHDIECQILSNEHIAIVDRDAPMPERTFTLLGGDNNAMQVIDMMIRSGYVKEVKE